MWFLLCSLGKRGHRSGKVFIVPVMQSFSLACDGVVPFWAHSPGSHCPHSICCILRRLHRVRCLADCCDLHVRHVHCVCKRLVHLAGGGDCDRCYYCRCHRCCDDTSNSCCIVCACKIARKPLVVCDHVCPSSRLSSSCWHVPCLDGAPCSLCNRLLCHIDARCTRRLLSLRCLLRLPITMRSPFC